MKRAAIVGNALTNSNFSKEIDSCDVVFRFNLTKHFSVGFSGSKCSVLILQRLNNEVDRRFLYSNNQLHPEVLKRSKEVWFLNTMPECLMEMIAFYGIKDKKIRTIDPNIDASRPTMFYWSKEKRPWNPSSLMIFINWILQEKEFEGYKKEVYCCTHEMALGHSAEVEKNLLAYYQSIGFLKMVY